MEALESKTYTTEKTLAERMNERLAELHMTKAEAAMRMNYSRSAVSQYLNGKYASDPTEIEKKITEFLIASGDTEGIPEAPDTTEDTGVKLKSKVEFFESRDFINTIGVCQACQENIGLGIIVGKSGQGKTHALKKYAKLQRVAYIECDDTMACRDLVEAIEMELGMPRSTGGTIWSRVNRIREFFNVNQKAILGQTLTSDSGGGSYAQSKTHNDVRHDLTVADAKALAVTIRRDIIRPLVEFNFGEDAELPFFTFDCQEVEDQKETVEIYKTLVCDMGLEIPKGHIYKKFSIPEPEEGEEVLKPPVKQMAPAVTGGSEILPEKTSPEDVKALKDGVDEQQQVDGIVSMANKQAADIFREMLKPILKVIDTASDMDELQAVLKDEAKLKKLYGQMESPELDDMIQQGIYLSHLVGRSMD